MRTVEGPTPTGGDAATLRLLDAEGTPTDDPQQAATGVITEQREGTVLARHYLERGTSAPGYSDPRDATGEPEESDDTKLTWDVFVNDDGLYSLAATAADLLGAAGWDELPLQEQRQQVGQLLVLPSWVNAPEALKADVHQWLVDTRSASVAEQAKPDA